MNKRKAAKTTVLLLVGGLVAGVPWRLRAPAPEEAGRIGPADPASAEAGREAGGTVFAADRAVPVAGARVRRDTLVSWIGAEGTAAACRRATVRTDAPGRVVAMPVREGQRVAAGELLARIDSTAAGLDLRRAEAEHERARAEFLSLTLGGEAAGLTSDERAERRRQARVRSGLVLAEVELAKARRVLAETRLAAPFAGRIANLSARAGVRLAAGDSVATVLDLSRVDVDVHVLQEEAPHLEPGRPARVRFTALPDDTFPGRVATVNPLVDEGSGTVRVTVRLRNPGARILPGMHASVRIARASFPDRLLVPREAIVERDGRRLVHVFVPSDTAAAWGRARWTWVRTGLESGSQVEIVPGGEGSVAPAADAVVLVDGHTTLIHDARVRLINADSLTAVE